MSKGYPFPIPNYSMNLIRQRTTLYKFLAGTRNWVLFLLLSAECWKSLLGVKTEKRQTASLTSKQDQKQGVQK